MRRCESYWWLPCRLLYGTHRGIEELEGKFAPSEEKLVKETEAVEKLILEKLNFVEEAKGDIEDKLKILRFLSKYI